MWKWDQQEPFGDNVADENPSGLGTFDLALRLPGQRYDRETNLSYNYNRDYDSTTGRYVQSDPMWLRGGLNTYNYVYQSPLLYSDRLALARDDDLGGGAKPKPPVGVPDASADAGRRAARQINDAVNNISNAINELINKICREPENCPLIDAQLRVDLSGMQVRPSGDGRHTVQIGGAIYCTYQCPSGRTKVEETEIPADVVPFFFGRPDRIRNFCPSSIIM